MRLTRPRFAIPGVFLLAAMLLAVSPEPRLAASDCGANSGNLCKETTSCAWILFFRMCTTTYDYYPSDDSDGPVEDGGMIT